MSTLIGRLLPTYVACAEREGNNSSAFLLPGEEAGLGHIVESRVREFATARACAKPALKQLGAPTVAVPRGLNREPIWPQGYVGSITHCEGYRGAAVARQQDTFGIGIDGEPPEPLPPEILSLVTVGAERDMVVACAGRISLGPAHLQRQGKHLQGLVPANPVMVGF